MSEQERKAWCAGWIEGAIAIAYLMSEQHKQWDEYRDEYLAERAKMPPLEDRS